MRRAILFVHFTIAVFALSSARGGDDETFNWAMGIIGTRVTPINRPDLEVFFITERAGELMGTCSLANVRDGTYEPVELLIRGEWRGDQFWPFIEYQVGDQYAGPWRTVANAEPSAKETNLVVKPGEVVPELSVSLEPFREFIGKYAVGKVVISSNDGGVFELSDLVPPSRAPRDSPQPLPVSGFDASFLEKGLIGAWVSTDGGETTEITITEDHKESWRRHGEDVKAVARWHIEGDDLVFTMETESEVGGPGTTRRERIKKMTSDELVFTDGSNDGRWTRVR